MCISLAFKVKHDNVIRHPRDTTNRTLKYMDIIHKHGEFCINMVKLNYRISYTVST